MLNTTSQPFSAEPCLAMAAIRVSLGGAAVSRAAIFRLRGGAGRTRVSSVKVRTASTVGPANVRSLFFAVGGSETSHEENGVTGLTPFRQLSSGTSETSRLSFDAYS